MPNHLDSDRLLDRALSTTPVASAPIRQTLAIGRDWRARPDTLTLDASYSLVAGGSGTRILARLGPHEVFLDEPLPLTAAVVGKPWGRELWLSGIEARGESGVRTGAGVLPLSHYLALAPRRLTGGHPLLLLKVLDPSPEPVLGDLYMETHETKHEVYVVSHVHPDAWPDGRGAIRYGMNQQLRRRCGDDDDFRRGYLDAVQRYETVRRALDAGEPVQPAQEARLRAEMETFTELRRLAVGEVVVVPTWLPHSLQHGVRVIEFQTPIYERYILSFNQRVVTQDHWDTAAAVPRLRLDLPEIPCAEPVADGVACIAAAEAFRVWRVVLDPGARFTLPRHASYALCVVEHGGVRLSALTLGAEDAAFVPGLALGSGRAELSNGTDRRASVLLAGPDL